MKTNKYKLLLATGLLLLSTGVVLKMGFHFNDFIPGFLEGMGSVFIIFSYVMIKRNKAKG